MKDKKRPLRHTVEELGEFADTNADGTFHLFQTGHDQRGRHSPAEMPWGCKVGDDGYETHYGACPDEAVQKALDAHDRVRNPDRCET